MKLVFIYGPAAAGKLTIARLIAERTGLALFHNHLIVDALAAVFPFGSPEFVRLRERFWLETMAAAAREGRSLIFTYAPESTVVAGFPERVRQIVEAASGTVAFVALTVSECEQERRLTAPSREAFGKLRSVALLRQLRTGMAACLAEMPTPELTIDTSEISAADAAALIVERLGL